MVDVFAFFPQGIAIASGVLGNVFVGLSGGETSDSERAMHSLLVDAHYQCSLVVERVSILSTHNRGRETGGWKGQNQASLRIVLQSPQVS